MESLILLIAVLNLGLLQIGGLLFVKNKNRIGSIITNSLVIVLVIGLLVYRWEIDILAILYFLNGIGGIVNLIYTVNLMISEARLKTLQEMRAAFFR